LKSFIFYGTLSEAHFRPNQESPMKKITTFLMDHGLTIMLIGFVLFFTCFLVILFAGRYYNFYLLQAAKTGAVVGFVTYVAGRIAVFFHNKRKKQSTYSSNLDDL
jgi:hypothetical protein